MMILKVVSFMFLFTLVMGRANPCNYENAISAFKRPTYDFSIQILDRVAQDTRYHFVFSPLSTWLQLVSLAEGARGPTQKEIWKITRYHRMKCFRQKFKEILNVMDEELISMSRRLNVMVFDKLLDVKETFENEVTISNSTKILSLYFHDPNTVAKVNEEINLSDSESKTGFDSNDFNLTVLLMSDTAYFKSDWQMPFDASDTSIETFYSETNVPIGKVKLMKQVGFFNLTHIPFIKASVLELPFNTNGRVSMLVFLPTSPRNGTEFDLFYNLKKINLMTIFSSFEAEGTKFVEVKLPRFNTTTEAANIPELLYDMGIHRMFYPEFADFSGITDFKMHTSMMLQTAHIEITEKGVSASALAQSLIKSEGTALEYFSANRPFAYLIVDKSIQVILFAGIYSNPIVF